MFEKGNKPSDWTPAPGDVDSAINTKANSTDVYTKSQVYTKDETNSQINVAKNAVTTSVSNLKTEVTEYGINNSLIEVYINVIVDVKMILPMYANTMQIVVVVPLAVKLIQGEVPKYYQRGYASSTLFFDEKST